MRIISIILFLCLYLSSYSQMTPLVRVNGVQMWGFGGVYQSGDVTDTISFSSVQPATLNQVTMVLQTLTAQDTLYLDWGEDAVVKVSGTTNQTITSQYGTNNTTYPIKIYGDLSKLTKFSITTEATVQGLKTAQLTPCTNLGYIHWQSLSTTGHILNTADLVGLPLTYLYWHSLGTSGHTLNTVDLVGMSLTTLYWRNLGASGHILNTADLVGMPLTTLLWVDLGTSGHTLNTANLVGMQLTTLYWYNLGTTGHTLNTANLVGMPLTTLYWHSLGTTGTGQVSDLPTGITSLSIIDCGTGISISSGTMKAWASTTITLTSGYTTASVDGFLNAWAPVAGSGVRTITLSGTGAGIANQPRSSASDAAVTTLLGLGKTILTTP